MIKKIKKIKKNLVSYSSLINFIVGCILAYFLFQLPISSPLVTSVGYLGILGIFAMGWLYSYGFSAPFATEILIHLHPNNLLITTLIGATGALFANVMFYFFSEKVFHKDIQSLDPSHPLKKMHTALRKKVKHPFLKVGTFILGAFMISSPLPDDIGITMLSGINAIHDRTFTLLCFALHWIGIYLILTIRFL